MLVYFTGRTETPARIARKFAPGGHFELAKWIYQANINTQAHRLIPGTDLYAPQRPIVIPVCPVLSPQQQRWQASILRRLDWLTPPARHNLYRAQQAGLDINHLLLAHELVQEANHYTADAATGLTLGFQTFEVASDLKTERLSKFRAVLADVKASLQALAAAPDEAARDIARSRFGQDVRRLNEEFKVEMIEFDLRAKALLTNSQDAIKVASEKGWQIFQTDILNHVERAARALRIAGRVAAVADAADGVWETFDAYLKGENWIKEAIRESADLGSFVITGWSVKLLLATFEITPVGWMATLAVGATIAGINYYVDKEHVNPLVNEYF
jgi:hypothetical protein